jgi:hypothetical protein
MGKPIHAIKWPSRRAGQIASRKRKAEREALIELRRLKRERLIANVAGQFDSFEDWVNAASRRIGERHCPVDGVGHPQEAICIDTKGRRCQVGADFHRARDEKTFPIRYFWNCEKPS